MASGPVQTGPVQTPAVAVSQVNERKLELPSGHEEVVLPKLDATLGRGRGAEISEEALARGESELRQQAGEVWTTDLYGPEGRIAKSMQADQFARQKMAVKIGASALGSEADVLATNIDAELLRYAGMLKFPKFTFASGKGAADATADVVEHANTHLAAAHQAVGQLANQSIQTLNIEKVVADEVRDLGPAPRPIQGMPTSDSTEKKV